MGNLILLRVLFICLSTLFDIHYFQVIPSVVNLDQTCFDCLCQAATGCDYSINCDQGYCGPFKISKVYWKDAGEVTMPDDNKNRSGAYEDCAISPQCSRNIVTNYIIKYGRDCNGDGITDCDDFSMINFNGGYQCYPPLNRSEPGIKWLSRYRSCYNKEKIFFK